MHTPTGSLLAQQQGGADDLERLLTTTVNNLPEDILLEIFHSHRQGIERLSLDYESSWNGRDGWFTLAHVCQKWRFVVLTSSSWLHLRLVFMSRRPLRATMFTRLPPLPIVVDYSQPGVWTLLEENRAVATLRSYPDRVRRIVISGWNYNLEGVCNAMDCSFPALESFELFAAGNPGIGASPARFEFPATMLMDSATNLRRLELKNVFLNSLSQLLSSTTGIVDLTLHIDTVTLSPAVSLLAYLQGMPCLRSLELQAHKYNSYNADGLEASTERGDMVSLSRLTRFYFDGDRRCLEALAAGLSAPFLQDLKIHLNNNSPMDPIPHLSRFIRDVEGQFFAAQVKSSREYLEISVLAHSHFIDEPVRRITIRDIGRAQISTALNAKLTAIEELFLESPYPGLEGGPRWRVWLGLLEELENVRILRIERGLVHEVGQSLSKTSAPDLLPALEEIELRSAVSRYVDHAEPISDIQREAVHATFGPFVTARQQTGRPVKIFWNADPALPRPYMQRKETSERVTRPHRIDARGSTR